MTDWMTWQLVDSAFPTGAFAHSWGLEAAWQQGHIASPEDLQRFLDETIVQTGQAVLPLVTAAYVEPARLEALNELAETFLVNPVANRASRVQGRTLVATALRIWPSPQLTLLARRAEGTQTHVAPLWGIVFGHLGVTLPVVRRMALHGAARGVLSAAVRLGITGSYEAQRLQHACGPLLERVSERSAGLTDEDIAQTAPLIDLFQAGHDRLYSRLFQS